MTRPQLTSLYTTGPRRPNGTENVTIIPCGIQTGSGTFTFWNGVHSRFRHGERRHHRVQQPRLAQVASREHDAAGLKAKGDRCRLGVQVVVSVSRLPTSLPSRMASPLVQPVERQIGSISDNGAGVNLGNPVSGVAPNMTPASTFYGSTLWSRCLQRAPPTPIVTGPGNNDIKTLFIGSDLGRLLGLPPPSSSSATALGAGCGTTSMTGRCAAASSS